MALYQNAPVRRGREAARLAAVLNCPAATAAALTGVIEHFDGTGFPSQAAGDGIPIIARILGVAQVATIWAKEAAPAEVVARVTRGSGSRFDPAVVRALRSTGWQLIWPHSNRRRWRLDR